MLSRRGFLRVSIGGTALLAAGAALLGRWRSRFPEEKAQLAALSTREARTLRAVADTMLPARAGFPSLDEVQLIARIDDKLAHLHPADVADIKTLLWVFEYGAPLLGPALGVFSALAPEDRRRYLARWEQSRLAFKRTGFAALKYFVMMVYYDHPAAWPGCGYDGHPLYVDRILPDEAALIAASER